MSRASPFSSRRLSGLDTETQPDCLSNHGPYTALWAATQSQGLEPLPSTFASTHGLPSCTKQAAPAGLHLPLSIPTAAGTLADGDLQQALHRSIQVEASSLFSAAGARWLGSPASMLPEGFAEQDPLQCVLLDTYPLARASGDPEAASTSAAATMDLQKLLQPEVDISLPTLQQLTAPLHRSPLDGQHALPQQHVMRNDRVEGHTGAGISRHAEEPWCKARRTATHAHSSRDGPEASVPSFLSGAEQAVEPANGSAANGSAAGRYEPLIPLTRPQRLCATASTDRAGGHAAALDEMTLRVPATEEEPGSEDSWKQIYSAYAPTKEMSRDLRMRQARFARLASTNLLRKVFGDNEPEGGDLSVTVKALRTERYRHAIQKQELAQRIELLRKEYMLHQAREERIVQLLERLDEMRLAQTPLNSRRKEILQIVYDINDVRSSSDDRGSLWTGKEFGRRCRMMVVGDAWKQQAHPPWASLHDAFQFAGGDRESGKVVLDLTGGSFAGRGGSLEQIADMPQASFRILYGEYLQLVKDILQSASSKNAEQRRQGEERVVHLWRELTIVDHIFFVNNPTHWTQPESWIYGDQDISVPSAAAHHRAVAAAGLSEEQCRQLWRIWGNRAAVLARLEHERQPLEEDMTAVLKMLQVSSPGSTSYISLLDAVDKLKANVDEAAVVNSVAIARGQFEVLTPLQMARMLSTAFPVIIDPVLLYDARCIPQY